MTVTCSLILSARWSLSSKSRTPRGVWWRAPRPRLSGCGHQVMQEVVEQRGLNRIFREQGSEAVDQELRQLVRLCETTKTMTRISLRCASMASGTGS